ncbi:hypothetical protein M2459_000572 [Parabacteroides sp. PF5-5]|uniref:DUF3868 domain-containing protein n=1 Tax=unclassified Parabacteroides TaxID=2649774 RepID=UPI002472F1F4|nr:MULTISPECIES: DUF3868 domain-containing protein [unclassified Parabacteroides]MDH6303495.1 hypothetical protein [Parabacteroides sp. PH5-39]MDH6314817.1 hypothetical protein [Parabacteroides sp. PF5-13]MDH6318154.1 hypothetical protein [Parabacteroides sp. PH5-13]MDH6321914.1 hypothetical protein [Parabacteroides sp. PH5-8]MDH6326038.1 hypothetical protein [Parabacteroides sp. PH5-41]
MKSIFTIIIGIIILGFSPLVQAQEAGTVTVKLNAANLKGQTLNLDMDIRINHVYIGKRESLSLTLALKKGNNIEYLPAVIINGANKRKMFERAVNLYGLEAAKGDAYAVLKNDEDLIQFLPYKDAFAYRSWMNNCQLLLIGEVLDYNNNVKDSFTDVLEKSLRITNANSPRRTATRTNTVAPEQTQDKPIVNKTQPTQNSQVQQPQTKQQQQEQLPTLRYRQGEYPSQQIRK